MKKILVFSIFAFVIMLPFARIGFALYPSTDPWPMYRYDLAHSGTTTSDPPSDSSSPWTYYVSAGGLTVVATPLVVDGRVIFQVTDRAIAVDETNGVELWKYQASGWLTAPTYADGKVFLGSGVSDNAGGVVCLNVSTGEDIWSKDLSTNYVKGAPLVKDGVVYIGVTGNYTYAYEAATGHYKWGYATDGPVYSSPASDGNILFFGSDNGTLYALNVSGPTPVQMWNFTANGAIRSTPSINDDRIFFGSDNNRLYAVNETTGELIWTWQTGNPSAKIQNGVAVANSIVYVTSGDMPKVYALYADAAPGNYTDPDQAISYWTRDVSSDDVGNLNEPVYANGKVVVTSVSGGNHQGLYVLDADVGNVIWKQIRGYWSSMGSAVVADGRVWYSLYYGDPAYSLNLNCIGAAFPPTIYQYGVNADGQTFDVTMETNSTITSFNTASLQTNGTISFKAQGIGTTNMCNITLPMNMLDGDYSVYVDGLIIDPAQPVNNGTHTWLYFTYNTTFQHTIEIVGSTYIPELQPIAIAPIMAAVLLIAYLRTRKIPKLR